LKFYVTFADAQLPIRYDYARATDRRSNVKGKVGIPADIIVNAKQTTHFFALSKFKTPSHQSTVIYRMK
jgi:hypothetical protein